MEKTLKKQYVSWRTREKSSNLAQFVDMVFANAEPGSSKKGLVYPTIVQDPQAFYALLDEVFKGQVFRPAKVKHYLTKSGVHSGEGYGDVVLEPTEAVLRLSRIGSVEEGWEYMDQSRRWRRAASICLRYSMHDKNGRDITEAEQQLTVSTTEQHCEPFLRQRVVTIGADRETQSVCYSSDPAGQWWNLESFLGITRALYSLRRTHE